MIILFFTCTHYCINIFLLLHIYNLLISSYTSFPIAYRTQTFGVPKSLKDPHITRVLGTPGPHIPSDMPPPPPHPHITRDMGTGVPKLGGPHFTQTPVKFETIAVEPNAFYPKLCLQTAAIVIQPLTSLALCVRKLYESWWLYL